MTTKESGKQNKQQKKAKERKKNENEIARVTYFLTTTSLLGEIGS